jgi:hypothetical protein
MVSSAIRVGGMALGAMADPAMAFGEMEVRVMV